MDGKMDNKPSVLLIITQDTKEEEARFARAALEEAGVRVVHLDPSVRRTLGGAEISPEDVATAAGTTAAAASTGRPPRASRRMRERDGVKR